MKNPFVEEIRKIRAKLNKMLRENPKQYEARIQAIREQYKDRLVRFPPKRLSETTDSVSALKKTAGRWKNRRKDAPDYVEKLRQEWGE
jgi:ElaB/YqjD/DUF883 family membrane-anchored ribosome-binding protein